MGYALAYGKHHVTGINQWERLLKGVNFGCDCTVRQSSTETIDSDHPSEPPTNQSLSVSRVGIDAEVHTLESIP